MSWASRERRWLYAFSEPSSGSPTHPAQMATRQGLTVGCPGSTTSGRPSWTDVRSTADVRQRAPSCSVPEGLTCRHAQGYNPELQAHLKEGHPRGSSRWYGSGWRPYYASLPTCGTAFDEDAAREIVSAK